MTVGSVDPQTEQLPLVEQHGLAQSGGLRAAGLLIALAVLLLVMLASLAFGAKPIAVSSVMAALLDYDPTLNDHLIVHTLRIPRTVLGLLVGAALGLAGAVMQGVARNPLADPGILGVEAGASLAVVLAIYVLGVSSLLGYVWFSFAGAAVVSVLVYALGALGREGATPVKLALAGAALGVVPRFDHRRDPARRHHHP